MKTNQIHDVQTALSSCSCTARVRDIGLTLGNLVLYVMPILILAVSISHWFAQDYLLELVAVFAGDVAGIFLVIRLERYRIRANAQTTR
ncbi:hypothetical protein NRY68_03575 [Acidithiobacillus ferrooxidans]|uniref:hypothetical protein n=1 Tax=Acidithiobacillus ferrooxidans TaxID=920 RepID=UPI0021492359|nr:hypothetical protein [Acidithiobacillus ferrooxidans]MCR1344899.1 hypothetical protein [Acidithiobacillus ferrooxidans]MCR1354013.1 hypothetical protein [Acidithiobacillus ferrooxidans]